MAEKEDVAKTIPELTAAEKIRLAIRYKAWYESCMNGTPLMSKIFTAAAGYVHNEVLKMPQNTDDEVRFVETYSTWHISCLEGKPQLDAETFEVATKVKKMFLTPDSRNMNPEFG